MFNPNSSVDDRREYVILKTLSEINFPIHPEVIVSEDYHKAIIDELDRIIQEAGHLKRTYNKANNLRD